MAIVNVDVEGLPDSDALPAGQYKLRIDTVSDPVEDKNGNEYISIGYTVTAGEYTNRKVFDNYVLLEGQSKLKKILRACKFNGKVLADTNEIVGLELEAVIKVKKSEEYGEQNNISVYLVK